MRDDSGTIGFHVIGELKADPGHLLLMGDDGHWYDYAIALGEFTRIEPNDAWAVDVVEEVALRLEPRRVILASSRAPSPQTLPAAPLHGSVSTPPRAVARPVLYGDLS